MITVVTVLSISVSVTQAETQSTTVELGSNQELSTESIAIREEELRRKEAELLRAMGLSQQTPGFQPSTSDSSGSSIEPKRAIQLDAPAESSQVSHVPVRENEDQHLESLKALETHPVLEGKAVQAASPPAISSKKDAPRGVSNRSTTSVRRPHTFTRVESFVDESGFDNYGTARSTTISLSQIERENLGRPQPITTPDVATIRNIGARLRTGPTRQDSTLLSLPQYSEVTIDYRSGEWYRVTTPSGIRGWVPGGSLLFDAGISPRSAVRIGAVRNVPR